jgi:rod shape-determining protein MreD
MDNRPTGIRATTIGVIVTMLLQVILAPNVAINDVIPNFALVFTVITAIRHDAARAQVVGFLLGLTYDLISQGPLGVMSLVLALLGYSAGSLGKSMLSGGWLLQLVILLVAAFFGELLHSVILAVIGYDSNFSMSLLMRVFPGTIYDAVFGLVIFPILARGENLRGRRLSENGRSLTNRGKLR